MAIPVPDCGRPWPQSRGHGRRGTFRRIVQAGGCAGGLLSALEAHCAAAFHVTAAFFGVDFFDGLARRFDAGGLGPPSILEVGSLNINGGLRSYAPKHCRYVGVDVVPGAGVDHVLKDPYHYPFLDESFDAVVSSSALEHAQFFWVTFLEMLRVVRSEGYVLVIVPSNLQYHGTMVPPDSWRFLADAASSLEAWGRRSGYTKLRALQGFVQPPVPWQRHEDNVMLFVKGASGAEEGRIDADHPLRGLVGQVKVATAVPDSLEATLDRILMHHWCWQSLSPDLGAALFELKIWPGLAFGFPFMCCVSFHHVGPQLSRTADTLGCWDNRTYDDCCPHVMTD